MTQVSTAAPLFDEAFISAIVTAANQDPSVEPALLADFDGTVKKLGLTSPVSGSLSKEGQDYTFTHDGGSFTVTLPAPRIAPDGELTDRDLDTVAGGKIDAAAVAKAFGISVGNTISKVVDWMRESHLS